MSERKLYLVEISAEVYVLAENEFEAERKAGTARHDIDLWQHEASEVGPNDIPAPEWEPTCLIYGEKKETTLGSVWPTVLVKEKVDGFVRD